MKRRTAPNRLQQNLSNSATMLYNGVTMIRNAESATIENQPAPSDYSYHGKYGKQALGAGFLFTGKRS